MQAHQNVTTILRADSFDGFSPSYADLPNEIVIKIFEYLMPCDLRIAGATCMRWRFCSREKKFTNTQTTVFTKIYFTDNEAPVAHFCGDHIFRSIEFVQVEFGESPKFWSLYGHSVEKLEFHECELNEKSLLMILKRTPNLQALHIHNCSNLFMTGRLFECTDDLTKAAINLNAVRHLSLTHNRYLTDALFNRIVALTPNLDCLDLSGCHISFHKGLYRKFYPAHIVEPSGSVLTFHYIAKFLSDHAPKMRQLHFNSTLIDGTALSQLAEIDGLTLERLELRMCDQLTNAGILNLVRCQTNLTHLNFSASIKLTDQSLLELCRHLPQLESLGLRACRALTDTGVREIVTLTKLQYLNIGECEGITGEGSIINGIAKAKNTVLRNLNVSALNLCEKSVVLLAQNFPELRYLNIGFCRHGVTDAAVQMIAKHLTKLRTLNLQHCDQISDAGLTGMGMPTITDDLLKNDEAAAQTVAPTHEPRLCQTNAIHMNDPEPSRPMRISLRSRAENEIVQDAMLKKYLLDICSQNVLDSNAKFSGYSLSRLAGLEQLDLSGCSRISDITLTYALQLPELRQIGISKCQQITESGISKLVANCPGIEMANLAECYSINDRSIEMIAVGLKRLRRLSLERCHQLSDFTLDYIALNCKRLSSLDLRGCRGMCAEPDTRLTAMASLKKVHISKPGPYVGSFQLVKPKAPPMPRSWLFS